MACILIVDDDCAVCAALRILLEYEGFQVVVAGHGASGLIALESAPVDLVLLDMRMPVLDGPETIRAIRRAGLRVPIIAMSGFLLADAAAPDEDVLAKALALGADIALRKPFKPKELLFAIEALLTRSSAMRLVVGAKPRGARAAAGR
jgi:DNA-binding response OmpR family regulator